MNRIDELENKLSEITAEYESKMKELNGRLENAASDDEYEAAEREINILEYCFGEEEADLNLKIIDEQIKTSSGQEKEILLLQKELMENDIKNNEELVILYTQLNDAPDDAARSVIENKINALQHSFSSKQSGISLKITDIKLETASADEKEILLLQKESIKSQKELDTLLASLYEKASEAADEAERKKAENTIELLNNSYQEKQDKINLLILNKELKTASGTDKERLELQKEMLNKKFEHNAEMNKLQNELNAAENENQRIILFDKIAECEQAYNDSVKEIQRGIKKLEN